jgi:2-oxoglutarate dehydrogenase E1 component
MDREPVLDAFRRWGYLAARLDDLGRLKPINHPALALSGDEADRARQIYCGPIGVEFMHMVDVERVAFVSKRMEETPQAPDRKAILARILRAEIFEQILQARYVGSKRYGLEGSITLIPLLDAMLEASGQLGAEKAVLGMAHRGRLNVIAHTLGKDPADIFAAFEDVDPVSVLGSGDVKYHRGATGAYRTANGREIHLSLVSNPSHLEAVDPVVLGRVRAKQDRMGASGRDAALAITIHGDAAFAGQGIAAETLNLAGLKGFDVGGTVRIIVNNLIGFTTNPAALHSSRFSSDLARRLDIPIFHVNGEDPDAVVRVAQIAVAYRYAFHSDVMIDLIGYRRYGHSEVDDPTLTQPRLYEQIQRRPPLWRRYAAIVGVPAAEMDPMVNEVRRELDQAIKEAHRRTTPPNYYELPSYWDPYQSAAEPADAQVATAVTPETIANIGTKLNAVPTDFAVHPKLQRLLDQRRAMAKGERPIDWAMAELLALGTLVNEGTPVRLCGEDSQRGTFNQRHAVLIDYQTEREYAPLDHLSTSQARFSCYNTALSEAAALGFEYGYSRDYPEALVLWEAQFGDFANGGQVIIDGFVAASEDKWHLLSGLVLLLPHGFEGQGPDHSSARIERFLQLAAEDNIQVCYPTSAAQYFHLLRRQARRPWRKPLIIMTPKGMLRHPATASPRADFVQGQFAAVLDDQDVTDAHRVLLCTGKIAHELRAERARRHEAHTAIIAVEQLYPFPREPLLAALEAHRDAQEILWVQEEPANMGALSYIVPRLQQLTGEHRVRSVKRAASASPATGSTNAHNIEQRTLLALAFSPEI